ncbi:histidine acid phosphatase [Ancylostoma caninum]|uniref:acid phosphatase n=1 Tax=Ancylostoma caninum TaxID=29170 RepID=A0A368H224_ANCCA|nr:histidine acid phosphatase [Ancylostoma caninum]
MGGSTSPESEAYYFRGKEHLTNKGLDQARELGLSLKRRYADTGFVDARYIPSEVSFRSSASERCLMTASAVASAMFNQTESGQPTFVPVFTVPKDKDFVCVPRVQCPPVMREMMKLLGLNGPLWKMNDMLSELFKQESERLNYTYNVGDRLNYFEPLFLEHESGLAVPQWFNDDARKEADHLLDLTIDFLAGVSTFRNIKWIHTRSGKLLSTILKNNQKATEKSLASKKLLAYSTHDLTISALLESMGVMRAALSPQGRPAFTAALVFELWKSNDTGHYVKILYRRGPGFDEYRDLTKSVEGCGQHEFCPIEDFSKSMEPFKHDHPEELCASDSENNKNQRSPQTDGVQPVTILFMVTTGIFAMLSLGLLFLLLHRRASVDYKVEAMQTTD